MPLVEAKKLVLVFHHWENGIVGTHTTQIFLKLIGGKLQHRKIRKFKVGPCTKNSTLYFSVSARFKSQFSKTNYFETNKSRIKPTTLSALGSTL